MRTLQTVVLCQILFVFSCASYDSFVYRTAADQFAEFLTFISSSSRVNVVTTLGNYRSCINKLLTVIFGCNPLTDYARLKSVIDDYV